MTGCWSRCLRWHGLVLYHSRNSRSCAPSSSARPVWIQRVVYFGHVLIIVHAPSRVLLMMLHSALAGFSSNPPSKMLISRKVLCLILFSIRAGLGTESARCLTVRFIRICQQQHLRNWVRISEISSTSSYLMLTWMRISDY